MAIKFRHQIIAEGESPSNLNDLKQVTDEDFDGYPYIIWDHRTGEVSRRLTQEEYDNLFIRIVRDAGYFHDNQSTSSRE